MEKTGKQFWLYIEPYVHISIKSERFLILNTLNKKFIEFESKTVSGLLKRISNKSNLQIIKISESLLKNPELKMFINEVREMFIGDIIDTYNSKGKPAIMAPFFNLQSDVNVLRKINPIRVGKNILGYLNEIILYINGECNLNCTHCKSAKYQINFCTKTEHNSVLSLEKIKSIIYQLEYSGLNTINIIGGDLTLYPNLNELVNYLNCQKKYSKYYYIYIYNFFSLIRSSDLVFDEHTTVVILIKSPYDFQLISKCVEQCNKLNVKYRFDFIVSSDKDIRNVKNNKNKLRSLDNIMRPYFNGRNIEFFEQNVYFGKDEIIQSIQSHKEIFANSIMNRLCFGKLIIDNRGKVYSNLNKKRIGSIYINSFHDILYKELNNCISWRKVRKNVLPCKKCIYNMLCPPISNYEFALKKNNLCKIFN